MADLSELIASVKSELESGGMDGSSPSSPSPLSSPLSSLSSLGSSSVHSMISNMKPFLQDKRRDKHDKIMNVLGFSPMLGMGDLFK